MAKKTHKSSAEARSAILDVTEELIAEVGPAGIRLSHVAKKAKMAHPNVLHHFGSREGLINAVANRISQRTADRVVSAIKNVGEVDPQSRVSALTHLLDSVYPDKDGRLAAWMHMSGVEIALADNIQRVAGLAQQLREKIHPAADVRNTKWLLLLIIYALLGEAVSEQSENAGFRAALGLSDNDPIYFRQWLAEIAFKLTDEQLDINSIS